MILRFGALHIGLRRREQSATLNAAERLIKLRTENQPLDLAAQSLCVISTLVILGS